MKSEGVILMLIAVVFFLYLLETQDLYHSLEIEYKNTKHSFIQVRGEPFIRNDSLFTKTKKGELFWDVEVDTFKIRVGNTQVYE